MDYFKENERVFKDYFGNYKLEYFFNDFNGILQDLFGGFTEDYRGHNITQFGTSVKHC